MTQKLIDLGLRRGRLIERIARQRDDLDAQLQPVRKALHTVDRVVDGVRSGVDFIRQRPAIVIAASTLFMLLKPRRIWRWTQRSVIVWRTWRSLKAHFAMQPPSR